MENPKDYVSVGDVCRSRLGLQCQYGSRYLDKTWESYSGNSYKFLGEGLRIIGNTEHYHSMLIHKDDVETFVERYLQYLKDYDLR